MAELPVRTRIGARATQARTTLMRMSDRQHLWSVWDRPSGGRIDCDLRFYDDGRVEVLVVLNGIEIYGHAYDTRAAALVEADTQLEELQADGWLLLPADGNPTG